MLSKYIIKIIGRSLIFVIATGLVISCSKQENLSAEEYLHWYNSDKNPLIKNISQDDISYDLKYKSSDYMFALNHINETKSEEYKKEIQKTMSFDFRLTSLNKQRLILDVLQSKMAEDANIDLNSLLSFGLKDNIKLYTETDTIKCCACHYIRNYDLAPYLDFVVEFPLLKESEATIIQNDFKVVFDFSDFQSGYINFNYTNSDFKSLPQLTL